MQVPRAPFGAFIVPQAPFDALDRNLGLRNIPPSGQFLRDIDDVSDQTSFHLLGRIKVGAGAQR